jgi:hypothetical protein
MYELEYWKTILISRINKIHSRKEMCSFAGKCENCPLHKKKLAGKDDFVCSDKVFEQWKFEFHNY